MPPILSRRHFIGTALTALGATALPQSSSLVAAEDAGQGRPNFPTRNHDNPFVYSFKIGAIEAWSISDGHMLFKEGVGLMWPPEKRAVMAENLVNHGEPTDGIPLYVNVLVIRLGREIVLFDSGFGLRTNPNVGWLAEGLASIGISPEQVTCAILSHGHADHLGGFVREGRLVYPNAALRVMKAEVDFWRSAEPDFSKSHRRDNIPNMIRDVRNAFDVLQPNLQQHRDGDQILNGAITFEAAPGHTDGHCVLKIQDGGESLLHLMDVAHHHLLMFTDPSWFIEFDHLPEVAVATRRRIFDRIGSTRERAYGFHLPWPGLGRVIPSGETFAWSPERWNWGS
jgi:glyoxylase-like metal-dependent hydrolase (beta-lactamase superfamily II)